MKIIKSSEWKAAFKILDELEKTSASRIDKIGCVRKGAGNQALLKLIRWTYGGDVYYTFPSKVPNKNKTSYCDYGKEMLSFEGLISRLKSRELSGAAAKAEVDKFISSVPTSVGKWLYRVLHHDWRCGVENSTFVKALGEDVWGDNVVKTAKGEKHRYFGCSLSHKYTSWPKGWKYALGEYKLDGWRGTAHVGVTSVTFYTRNGKHEPHTTNLKHIGEQLLKVGFKNCIVDGEVLVGDSWNAVAKIGTKRMTPETQKILHEQAVFRAFDYVPLVPSLDALADEDMPFKSRRKALRKILKGKENQAPNVRLVKQWKLNTEKDISQLYEKALAKGFEGLMVKDPDAPYPWKRSKAILKIKPVRDVDVFIIEPRAGNGKHEGRLGTLVCLKADGTEVRVGGGYSDKQREELWKRRKSLPGHWLEAIETDPGSTLKEIKLNHPRFKRFRPDKDGGPLPKKIQQELKRRGLNLP